MPGYCAVPDSVNVKVTGSNLDTRKLSFVAALFLSESKMEKGMNSAIDKSPHIFSADQLERGPRPRWNRLSINVSGPRTGRKERKSGLRG